MSDAPEPGLLPSSGSGAVAASLDVAAVTRKRVDPRDVVRTLSRGDGAVVYVTDNETLWEVAGVDAGCFVLSDCSRPVRHNVRERNVTPADLALRYWHVEPGARGA